MRLSDNNDFARARGNSATMIRVTTVGVDIPAIVACRRCARHRQSRP
jgi:hypothetical protein